MFQFCLTVEPLIGANRVQAAKLFNEKLNVAVNVYKLTVNGNFNSIRIKGMIYYAITSP